MHLIKKSEGRDSHQLVGEAQQWENSQTKLRQYGEQPSEEYQPERLRRSNCLSLDVDEPQGSILNTITQGTELLQIEDIGDSLAMPETNEACEETHLNVIETVGFEDDTPSVIVQEPGSSASRKIAVAGAQTINNFILLRAVNRYGFTKIQMSKPRKVRILSLEVDVSELTQLELVHGNGTLSFTALILPIEAVNYKPELILGGRMSQYIVRIRRNGQGGGRKNEGPAPTAPLRKTAPAGFQTPRRGPPPTLDAALGGTRSWTNKPTATFTQKPGPGLKHTFKPVRGGARGRAPVHIKLLTDDPEEDADQTLDIIEADDTEVYFLSGLKDSPRLETTLQRRKATELIMDDEDEPDAPSSISGTSFRPSTHASHPPDDVTVAPIETSDNTVRTIPLAIAPPNRETLADPGPTSTATQLAQAGHASDRTAVRDLTLGESSLNLTSGEDRSNPIFEFLQDNGEGWDLQHCTTIHKQTALSSALMHAMSLDHNVRMSDIFKARGWPLIFVSILGWSRYFPPKEGEIDPPEGALTQGVAIRPLKNSLCFVPLGTNSPRGTEHMQILRKRPLRHASKGLPPVAEPDTASSFSNLSSEEEELPTMHTPRAKQQLMTTAVASSTPDTDIRLLYAYANTEKGTAILFDTGATCSAIPKTWLRSEA